MLNPSHPHMPVLGPEETRLAPGAPWGALAPHPAAVLPFIPGPTSCLWLAGWPHLGKRGLLRPKQPGLPTLGLKQDHAQLGCVPRELGLSLSC